jgi:hypothetical protein
LNFYNFYPFYIKKKGIYIFLLEDTTTKITKPLISNKLGETRNKTQSESIEIMDLKCKKNKIK